MSAFDPLRTISPLHVRFHLLGRYVEGRRGNALRTVFGDVFQVPLAILGEAIPLLRHFQEVIADRRGHLPRQVAARLRVLSVIVHPTHRGEKAAELCRVKREARTHR
jgi:hypothetical protein